MSKLTFLAALVLALAFSSVPEAPVSASEQIGAATKIVRTVTGRLAGRSARLTRGDTVFQNQRVRAASQSYGQFSLRDGSKLAVNANSSLTLDRAVFSGSSGSLVLKAAKGAFRFATGNMPSSAYKIVTPSSTIGVRGTMFDVFVGRRGQTIITLLYGEVDACNQQGQCRTLRERCDAVRIERNGRFVQANRPNRAVLGDARASRAIPFLLTQRRLTRSMRIPTYAAARCASASAAHRDELDGPEGENDADSNDADSHGSGGTGGSPGSDIRLKRDVKQVETLADGLTLYSFRYIWGEETYVGVMAQDVLKLYPEAVSTGPHGYYRVDYRMLDLDMPTLDEWSARRAKLKADTQKAGLR